MKSQQPKEAATAKSAGGQPAVSPSIKQKGMVLTSDHREQSLEHWPRPSELELANLAARLARAEKIDPKQLVKEAWELYWESCRKIQADHIEVGKMLEATDVQDDEMWAEERGGLPEPEKFPVTFQEMELLLLPKLKGRTWDRAWVFREYALAQIVDGSFTFRGGFRVLSYWDFQPEVLEELRERQKGRVAERFGSWRASVYGVTAYAKFAGSFLRWYGRWTERRRSEARASNARKGWEKRRKDGKMKTGARTQSAALRRILEQG
jgi:hypothetical protein